MANSKKPQANNGQAATSTDLLSDTKRRLTALFEQQHLTKPTLLVALSGGMDSMVLLDVLNKLKMGSFFTLEAMHIHHGLSPSADSWMAFCEQQCAHWGVPLTVARVAVDTAAGAGIEAAARRARYAALTQTKADFICTAHHLDDQAETILLQLMRGAGLKGLSAMPLFEARRRLIRPLLEVSRADLQAYAQRHQLAWVTDESNDNLDFDRNFMRRQVIPLLKQRYPSLTKTLARSSGHIAQTQDLLEDLAAIDAAQAVEKKGQHLVLQLNALQQLSLPRQHNVVRWWLAQHHLLMPSTQQLQMLVAQLTGARKDAQLAVKIDTAWVRRYQAAAYCIGETQAFSAPVLQWRGEESLSLPDHSQLQLTRTIGQGLALRHMTADRRLQVRYRQGGERFLPQANRPHRTLKQVFQAQAIPPWLRATWPLVFIDDILVMIPGVGTDPRYLAQANEPSLWLRWQPNAPDD